MIWKWICYIVICSDVLSYIIKRARSIENFAMVLGFAIGIIIRLCVLYNLATCWLFA